MYLNVNLNAHNSQMSTYSGEYRSDIEAVGYLTQIL